MEWITGKMESQSKTNEINEKNKKKKYGIQSNSNQNK